jgi:hypothetical protein
MINVGDNVEIHPGYDLWMRGAQTGKVVSIKAGVAKVRMHNKRVKKLQSIPVTDLKKPGHDFYDKHAVTEAQKLLSKITEESHWKVQFLDADGHEGLQTVAASSQADAAAIAKRTNPEIRSIQSVEIDPDKQAFGDD